MSYPSLDEQAPPQSYPPGAEGYYPQDQPQSGYPDQYHQDASLATGMQSMSLKPKAGESELLSKFGQGNVVVLESAASGKSLRINNGDVEGIGGRGKLAQFTVHVRRPGVVALQNVNNPDNWIAIYENKLIGTATGGPYCDLLVGEIEGTMVTLESTTYPGHHVGILPDGTPKAPGDTKTGQHGRFKPVLLSESSPPLPPAQPQPPPVEQLPPYSQAPQGPPQGPPQGYPPASYPQVVPVGYPPQPVGYAPGYPPPPAGYPPQPQQPPPPFPEPAIPLGFNIMDSFKPGTLLQLICRGNGNPLFCHQGRVLAKGILGKPLCNWVVVLPSGAPPGTIMLQNEVCKGIYIAINKGGFVGAGKGHKFCHLQVEPLPDNYVRFRSMEMPNMHLNFFTNGSGGNNKTALSNDSNSQFFIRMEKDLGGYNQRIITPKGTPSNANNMLTGFVIQLYSKSDNLYLAINKNGIIYTTVNANDNFTYFVVKNRGMGIISLGTRKFPGYRLRMENSVLKGKGVDDLNADFRIMDNNDGTMTLQSVTCPTAHVGINSASGLHIKLNVMVLEIQRFGTTENITRKPAN